LARDALERRVDGGEGDAAVLRVDCPVAHRPPPANVDELDPARRLGEFAASEDDRGRVELAQRFEDDLRADAGRIAEGDGERLHCAILVRADDVEAGGAGGGGKLAVVGREEEGLTERLAEMFGTHQMNRVQGCKLDWETPARR